MRKHYKLDISDKEIAFLAQRVEKEVIGVTGGIMDQMISSKLLFYINIKINITFRTINSVLVKLVMVLEVHLMGHLKIWEYLLTPLVVRSLIQE